MSADSDEFGITKAQYAELEAEETFVRGFDRSVLCGDSDNQVGLALGCGFSAGYRAALPQWVPIADVPDEWKDGRTVDLWFSEFGGFRVADCTWGFKAARWDADECFYDERGESADIRGTVTHAMLPPKAPS